MFWTPSTEEESVEIDLIDLSTKNVVFPSEPSSPTESDESDDSKTIQNSPEPILSWVSKSNSSSLSGTEHETSSHLSGEPILSSGPPNPASGPVLSNPPTGNRSLPENFQRVMPSEQTLSNPPFQFNPNAFVQNMDPVSQYLLNQYLYQQLIAMSRVNSMNGAASLSTVSSNLGRNLIYNPLAQMPLLPVPFSNPMQMPVQLSLPFQYPFIPVPMDFSMMNQSPLMNPVQYLHNTAATTQPAEIKPDNPESTTTETPKKRRAPSKRASRKVRPKVIPEKGAIQCQGTNRKKNKRCRNAALMEFIGPRPIYCAEHIHLDPDCLYTKCKSNYQKVPGDKKGCREVVLKEFNLCHKHYHDAVKRMKGFEGVNLVLDKLVRVTEILNNLEDEALKAKKTDADLFQRKNKLIPKFHQIRNILKKRLCELYLEGFPLDTCIPLEYLQDPDSIIPLSILQTAYQPKPPISYSPEPVLDKTLEL
jgi:hypothetical protein